MPHCHAQTAGYRGEERGERRVDDVDERREERGERRGEELIKGYNGRHGTGGLPVGKLGGRPVDRQLKTEEAFVEGNEGI